MNPEPDGMVTPLPSPSVDRGSSRSSPEAEARDLAALALVAAAVIASEILLTRIFSFITWHHYTPLVIGIALLGFGFAGSYLSVRPFPGDAAADPSAFRAGLAREALAFAFLLPLMLALVSRVPFNPKLIFAGPAALGWLLLEIALIVVPFAAAGLFVCRMLTRFRTSAGRVYGTDLAASAAGVLLGLGLLRVTSAEVAILGCAVVSAVAARILAPGPSLRRYASLAVLALVLLGLAAAFFQVQVFLPSPSKEMAEFSYSPELRHLLTWSHWNPIARIDITEEVVGPALNFGGEISPKVFAVAAEQRYRHLYQDGTAPSAFLHIRPPFERNPLLLGYLQSAPYVVRPGARALVIGLGGGIDIAIALARGARSVTGVEVNPLTVGLLKGELADYNGGLARDPRVTILNAEGRAFARSDRAEPYDVIQLSGVDTFAALVSGSGSLTEGYLYTVEGVGDFLARLKPGGILSYSRPYFVPPRETLKLVATALEALRIRGAKDPAAHVFVLAGESWADTLISPSPLSAADTAALEGFAREMGFKVLATPSAEIDTPWDRYLALPPDETRRFRAIYFYDVEPATDDRPFFYDYARWGQIFKNKRLSVNTGFEGYYTAESSVGPLPVGNLTLAAAVLAIGLLAAVLIVIPLLNRSAALTAEPGLAVRVLGACAALGLGFIAVEITLIQQFQLFLGGPAIALGTVLFALLGAAGLGSRLAERLTPRHLVLIMPAIAVLIAGLVVLIPWVTHELVGAALLVRGIVAVMLTAVPGFLMGMPFPLLIRRIAERQAGLVPWAWAANGFLSVLGSVVTTFVAMFTGFRVVTLAAAAVYLLGLAALAREIAVVPPPRTSALQDRAARRQ